jgi:hypothetical protein
MHVTVPLGMQGVEGPKLRHGGRKMIPPWWNLHKTPQDVGFRWQPDVLFPYKISVCWRQMWNSAKHQVVAVCVGGQTSLGPLSRQPLIMHDRFFHQDVLARTKGSCAMM